MTPNERLLLLAACACALLCAAGVILYRLRTSPAEREKRRRVNLNQLGRMSDGILTDLQDNTIYYSYSVAGVAYTASQDVTTIRALVPEDPGAVIGPVTLKYLPRNPANSIIVCEQWSGLRPRREQPAADRR